ncbi:membrane protein [Staphylococcus gallinarum]|uniref:Membrane protein n=1 Tax=Staphylococcus gallinarum TaxID=1293 RepID=A0A380FGW5_STAGA|nr:membrane protein [Staphylococcus gallinarum]
MSFYYMFLMPKTIDVHLFVNEILLLIVGLGIAFLMNLIMPSLDGTLKHFKKANRRSIHSNF